MRSFEYQAPTSIDEAMALLADKGARARPLAGGTDLLVQMRRGVFELDLLVDIKRIPELNRIAFDPTGGLTVGAAVTCARLCEDEEVRETYPALIDAASIMGGVAIQGRATLGGNLCNAAPSGDSIPAMIVLGAICTIVGPRGTRPVPVEEFCIAPGRSVLDQGEILLSIHLPAPRSNSGASYLRFIPRHEMDIAVVGAGASIVLNDDHTTITDARVALGAVAPTPLLVGSAAAALVGRSPAEDAYAEAAMKAREAARPITDVRGTDAQRDHLVGVLVKRALRGATARAKGEPTSGDQD